MTKITFETPSDVLSRWLKRARESQLSHHLMAEKLGSRNNYFGVATIVITAISGATTLMTSLTGEPKVLLGIASLAAAVLASLQTFLKNDEKANLHKASAASYGSVRRLLELASAADPETIQASLKVAKEELDKLAKDSPSVSKKIFDEAIKRSE
jgi:hypothetical protein